MSSLVRLNQSILSLKSLGRTSNQLARLASHVAENKITSAQLQDFNPKNYSLPLDPPTLSDTMEPYGCWKVAYEAEKKRGNRLLLIGIVSFTTSCLIFYNSGVMDGLYMPNLDNLMEDTEPYTVDKEDRITV